MARKITPQEECMMCAAFPCTCPGSKPARAKPDVPAKKKPVSPKGKPLQIGTKTDKTLSPAGSDVEGISPAKVAPANPFVSKATVMAKILDTEEAAMALVIAAFPGTKVVA